MEKIEKILKKIIEETFGIKAEAKVEKAPELQGRKEGEREGFRADFATNVAMKISKEVGKNPREIGEILREVFLKEDLGTLEGTQVEIAGPGFLNFMLPDEYFKEKLGEFGGNLEEFKKNISRDEYLDKTVVTEFSDPNPFKVLHIGHFYTSVVGESISRLFELSGAKVYRVNFGGDVGLHVGKTIYSLIKKGLKEFTIEDVAECYVEGTREYEEDEEARKEIIELNKKIYQIAENGEREGEIAKIYWKGRELSYRYFEDFYEKIGVKFDKFYPESEVAEKGVREVVEHTPGVYEKSEGATVFKGEKFGLHTRVFINKEGLPTYETKDVGLLFEKWADFKFDESVVITGNDIIEYMKVVLKSVEQYAPELVQKTRHLTHGNVKLPGAVKMSSRKGNFIKAVDVLEDVREKTSNDLIVLGAIKYAFLKYRIGGDIEFDIEESVSTTGNSGVYLQYSCVRAKKILKEDSEEELDKGFSKEWELNPFEVRICKKFVEYPEVIKQAVREMAPNVICNYLFETAQEFSRFYENCKVNGSEFEAERRRIVRAFRNVMEQGLGLLGIEVPEEM
ncbi:arginine--tRNA ligase [Candidatus Saccharibacteria bacterium]|nr:arginine--tRNA ligase [Candidatus Saccharibacteria bacterium]